jgi:hypothetical protein
VAAAGHVQGNGRKGGLTYLGLDQHHHCVDWFAFQSIWSKRHGVAVGAVYQRRELISKPLGIANAESMSRELDNFWLFG